MGGYDLSTDRLYGHIVKRKGRTEVLAFLKYLRSLHPLRVRIDETLGTLAHDLVHDPAMGARVARIKADALANPAFAAWMDAMWERSRAGLIALLRAPGGANGGFGGDIGSGMAIVAYLDSQDAYIADNTITGTTQWNEASLTDGGDNANDGITVSGPGHVIMNNRVSGFRDDITLLDDDDPTQQYSVDILNNIVTASRSVSA